MEVAIRRCHRREGIQAMILFKVGPARVQLAQLAAVVTICLNLRNTPRYNAGSQVIDGYFHAPTIVNKPYFTILFTELVMHLCPMEGLLADTRGSISILMAVGLTVIMGAAALGIEASSWLMATHGIQNAADTAVLAASMNGGANYAIEAKAVTALYGYVDGAHGAAVTVSNVAACPAGGNNCYSVNITQSVPLFLAPLVGYTGNVVVNGQRRQTFAATAVASLAGRSYCLLALASSGAEGILTNGAPQADLSGCNIMSNTDATCHGHNLNADYGDAHGTDSGCGATQTSGVPLVSDPYLSLAQKIPSSVCPSYPQEPSLLSSNLWSASSFLSGTVTVCGDLKLTGDVTLSGADTFLLIKNGRLDLNGHTLKTASGTALTIVFTGDSAGGYTHAPTGSGTLDIAAPTSGPWAGVAIYQDPSLTLGVDISAAGNSPTWDITGLVYLPHASVTFSGAVNKSSNGSSCFVLVVDNITINGTGSILSHGGCPSAGLVMPGNRLKLLK